MSSVSWSEKYEELVEDLWTSSGSLSEEYELLGLDPIIELSFPVFLFGIFIGVSIVCCHSWDNSLTATTFKRFWGILVHVSYLYSRRCSLGRMDDLYRYVLDNVILIPSSFSVLGSFFFWECDNRLYMNLFLEQWILHPSFSSQKFSYLRLSTEVPHLVLAGNVLELFHLVVWNGCHWNFSSSRLNL